MMPSAAPSPYGVYDVTNNRGFICVGTSGDTPAFAVDTITAWWQTEGKARFRGAGHLLLLADAGGSNGCQFRAWKERLQVQICDRRLVCHDVLHVSQAPPRVSGRFRWSPKRGFGGVD